MKNHPSIEQLRKRALELYTSGAKGAELQQQFLGRKGELTLLLRSLSSLPMEERVELGQAANLLKDELQMLFAQEKEDSLPSTLVVDPTVPAFAAEYGTIHPISAMTERMVKIFTDLSFEVVEGNELVTEKENFEQLNIDKDHPARDAHDSFYLADNLLLRTHTTAVQVLEMNRRVRNNHLPIRVVVPGKTYRRESDQTHSPMFHQIDAIMVDSQTTFADLKGVLEYFVQRLFGNSVETRFRPHFFPFTEPSAEIDIRWRESKGEGKHTQWLEMLGCGMIHPAVLKRAGINPRIYQGWAFGLSIERPIMISKQIPDLRLFYHNALPFLNQFPEQL